MGYYLYSFDRTTFWESIFLHENFENNISKQIIEDYHNKVSNAKTKVIIQI